MLAVDVCFNVELLGLKAMEPRVTTGTGAFTSISGTVEVDIGTAVSIGVDAVVVVVVFELVLSFEAEYAFISLPLAQVPRITICAHSASATNWTTTIHAVMTTAVALKRLYPIQGIVGGRMPFHFSRIIRKNTQSQSEICPIGSISSYSK